jgi:probable F420-dependent oxidoreductase
MPASTDSGADQLFDKFGTYILPGRVADPQRGLEEATEAERIGLGAVWISERYATKEPAVLSGAVSQLTKKVRIAGTMYVTMRNPVVTASVANLMQQLTGDRFRLLLAKAVPHYLASLGSPPIIFKRLADSISIYRRLWAGETVNYDGILGSFPNLVLTDRYDGPPPPIIFTAIGPKSLAFAGEHCDGVLTHPFITIEGLASSIKIVRQAAEKAGRDPDSVRIYHNIIVAPDLPKDTEEAVVGGRAITYFQTPGFGEIICEINGWDTAVLDKIRTHPQMLNLKGNNADQSFTRDQLVEVSRVLPQQWLDDGAAVGTAAQCAAKLGTFLDAGADEILLHGSAPADMGPLTDELRKMLG